MKNARQEKILRIISSESIETQNQLMEALERHGIKSTQATLSRDIRDMKLIKLQTSKGTYRYAVPGPEGGSDIDMRLRKVFKESVLSCAKAQNLVVIKTLSGMANAACAALDAMEIPGLVGSIAGDDTVFLAMRDISDADAFIEEIKSII